jgi:hypothetical protein
MRGKNMSVKNFEICCRFYMRRFRECILPAERSVLFCTYQTLFGDKREYLLDTLPLVRIYPEELAEKTHYVSRSFDGAGL